MRRGLLVILMIGGIILSARVELSACGDKFLLVGRGARFSQAYAAIHPASILVFSAASAPKGAVISDPRFLTALKRAGHSVQVVDARSKVPEAIAAGRFDIVLAAPGDAIDLQPQLETFVAGPQLLPVMDKPSRAEAETVTRQFGILLNTSDKISRSLAQIDHLMKERRNGARTSKAL